jgi:hypothetical protein
MVHGLTAFLAALSLLLPPGVCLCRCPGDSPRTAADGHPHPEEVPCPCRDPDHPADPDDHAPGCPALKVNATLLALKPGAPRPAGTLAWVPLVPGATGAAPAYPEGRAGRFTPLAGQPLYLTLCTLRL